MKKKPVKSDRHLQPQLVLRLPLVYKRQLMTAAKKNRRTMTEEAKIAFEEYLAKQKLWPPSEQKQVSHDADSV